MGFSYRLAAIDLDATLLGPDHRISARNGRAIRALSEAGVECVIASGRMHEATTRYADELGLSGPIISYNGAMIKHRATGEVWLHVPAPADCAAEVIDYCEAHGRHLNFYMNDMLYIAERGRWAELYLKQTGSPVQVVGSLKPLQGVAPTKMILIDTPETTDALMSEFKARFGDRLYITKSNPEYLEFMNPAVSKGSALALVAERLGVCQADTMAFGDGSNDVPMLRWAGLGVAMGNAQPHVRAIADRVAPPCAEDGLGAVIEELLAGA